MVFCAVLIGTGYLKCPYWDQWWIVSQLAEGASPFSLQWLWSQQNEHRILFTRLIVSLDVYKLGARNLLPFGLIFTIQLLHLFLWIFAIRRWCSDSLNIRLVIAGVFGYCLFCPNQIENFVWAFQFTFLIPFFLATLAFICVLLMSEIKQAQWLFAVVLISPLVALSCLAIGLFVWPFLILLATKQKLPRWVLVVATIIAVASIAFYLHGYRSPAYHSNPLQALQMPVPFFRYVLTFFGTSWWFLLPHLARTIAMVGIVLLLYLAAGTISKRSVNKFKLLLAVEGVFLFGTALITASGRVLLGVGQAGSSRYQTPAMLFWAIVAALCLLWLEEHRKRRLLNGLQTVILIVVFLSAFAMPSIYRSNLARSGELRAACEVIATGGNAPNSTKKLSDYPDVLAVGGKFLRSIWNKTN